jgi:hypothetical protein
MFASKPLLRIIKTMLEDRDVFVRPCREGYEFFKSLHQRKEDFAAARTAPLSPAPAGGGNDRTLLPIDTA